MYLLNLKFFWLIEDDLNYIFIFLLFFNKIFNIETREHIKSKNIDIFPCSNAPGRLSSPAGNLSCDYAQDTLPLLRPPLLTPPSPKQLPSAAFRNEHPASERRDAVRWRIYNWSPVGMGCSRCRWSWPTSTASEPTRSSRS
jgi:hypothetical protein